MRRTFRSQDGDNDDIDEIESESYCFSNSGHSHSQSFNSEGLSRSSLSSHKKSDGPSTRVHSTKSNSSGGTRRDKKDSLDQCLSISRDQKQLVTLAGIVMIGIFLLFMIIIIGLLVYCNNKVKAGSSRKGETGGLFFSDHLSLRKSVNLKVAQMRKKKRNSARFS